MIKVLKYYNIHVNNLSQEAKMKDVNVFCMSLYRSTRFYNLPVFDNLFFSSVNPDMATVVSCVCVCQVYWLMTWALVKHWILLH